MPEILVPMPSIKLPPRDVKIGSSSRKSQNSLNAQPNSSVPGGENEGLK